MENNLVTYYLFISEMILSQVFVYNLFNMSSAVKASICQILFLNPKHRVTNESSRKSLIELAMKFKYFGLVLSTFTE